MILIDTSALLAIMDADDRHHAEAALTWTRLVSQDRGIVCTNYILVETLALVQNRFGMEAVRRLHRDVVPWLSVEWVSDDIHEAALSALLIANRRHLSLVDCVSFEVARRKSIHEVFTYDRHFSEYGFDMLR